MELDRVFETMGINSIAATAESGLKELPECLVPVVRSSVLDFARIEVDGRSLVVVELPAGSRVSTISNILGAIDNASGCRAMAFFSSLSKYVRDALIGARIAFATEDGQFFLPGTMSLLPMEEDKAPSPQKSLTPSEMRAFIWWLSRREAASSQDLADDLQMPKSTASRVCETLVEAGVLSKRMLGKRKHTAFYSMPDPVEGVRKGSKAFGDPVKYVLHVDEEDAEGLLLCGESALAERSLLAHPSIPVFAASPEEGKKLASHARPVEKVRNLAKVMALAFDPRPQSDGRLVDCFTMMKTVENLNDERVALALDEAMGDFPWYESLA